MEKESFAFITSYFNGFTSISNNNSTSFLSRGRCFQNDRQHLSKSISVKVNLPLYISCKDNSKIQSIDKIEMNSTKSTTNKKRIAIIGKKITFEKKEVIVDSEQIKKGLSVFGMRANAYWESIGALPIVFASLGIIALVIKMVKVKGGQFRTGEASQKKLSLPKSAITSEEQEAELHVFKCGNCGYEMYPARGRESKFFPDSFKCPLCGSPRNQFYDRNDPDDPRNQEDDDDEEEEEEEEEGDNGNGKSDSNGKDGDGDGNSSNDDGGTEITSEDSKSSSAVPPTQSSSDDSVSKPSNS